MQQTLAIWTVGRQARLFFTSLLTVTYMAPPGSRTKKAQRLKLENTGCLFLLPWYLSLVTFNSNNQASPFYKVALHLVELEWTECACSLSGHMDTLCCAILWAKATVRRAHADRERERKKEEQPFSRHSAALQGGLSDACRRLNQPIQTNTSTDKTRHAQNPLKQHIRRRVYLSLKL